MYDMLSGIIMCWAALYIIYEGIILVYHQQ